MSRQRIIVPAAALVVSFLAISTLASSQAMPAEARAGTQVRRAGILALRNPGPDSMRIEVRLASDSVPRCDSAAQRIVRVVPPGKEWLVAARRPICWRRGIELPSGQMTWTSWRRQSIAPGQRLEATPSP